MKPDTLAHVFNVNLPKGGLPLLLVAIMLFGYFAAIIYAISRASQFKGYAQDFPTQAAPVVVALILALLTAPVVLTLIALRIDAPDGTGGWLAFIATMAGVAGVGGLAVKRVTSPEYMENKAKVEAAKASAQAPSPQVNVAGDATVQAGQTTERPVPAPSRSTDTAPIPGKANEKGD